MTCWKRTLWLFKLKWIWVLKTQCRCHHWWYRHFNKLKGNQLRVLWEVVSQITRFLVNNLKLQQFSNKILSGRKIALQTINLNPIKTWLETLLDPSKRPRISLMILKTSNSNLAFLWFPIKPLRAFWTTTASNWCPPVEQTRKSSTTWRLTIINFAQIVTKRYWGLEKS